MRYLIAAVAALCLTAALSPIASAAEKTKIVFIAGKPSHGPGDHEHRAGSMLLAKALNESGLNIDAQVTYYGWPQDASILNDAAAIVVYCDGGEGHLLNEHFAEFQPLMDKGVGLVCLHYAVENTAGERGNKFLEWLGGYFEMNWSVNPHWDADYKSLPSHPITSGVSPFGISDEWYYHMRFPADMKGVTPILSTVPPESSLSRPDGTHSGNPDVRKAVANGEPQHMAWAFDRANGGRSFGFTGGHFHKNWQNDNFRTLVLNAIAWTAKVDVPKDGVSSKTPTDEEMKANLDDKKK